jgi:cytochrome c-type biogenesis protein CcmH
MRPPCAPSRARRLPGLIVLLALVAAVATLTVVGLRGESAASTRAQQVQQIASGLRCPVCQDLSAADSPAPLAGQMRHQIAEQLASGRSPDQIRQGFIAAYGDSVLMSPPHTGLGRAAYLLPLLLLGAGLVVAALQLRRWRRVPDPGDGANAGGPLPESDPSDLRIVERALMRLREVEGR